MYASNGCIVHVSRLDSSYDGVQNPLGLEVDFDRSSDGLKAKRGFELKAVNVGDDENQDLEVLELPGGFFCSILLLK